MFHLMTAIPFGVSYFPVGWSSADNGGDGNDSGRNITTTDINDSDDDVNGVHYRKGSFGIRMFLFHRRAQVIFTLFSHLNPIGLQMVENVSVLSRTRVHLHWHQGYGMAALSTLFSCLDSRRSLWVSSLRFGIQNGPRRITYPVTYWLDALAVSDRSLPRRYGSHH
jgi:hypothetical protein